ncbi:HEAT repeat domain-containing protein [Anabaena sp. 4-3]|uniref:HEAT repeat domain-containing protein n=1 Tax=Anabaena sp. 4-3 TaxID=1811979 RepID=UPI000834F529|nr:HEAT repeat domain-containing protein [Anabaena sp. 4-3]
MVVSFYPELDNLNIEDLKKSFHSPPLPGEDAALYYQEVAHLIKSQDEVAGKNFLLQEINNANTEQLQAILFALTETPLDNSSDDTDLFYLLKSYLEDERPLIVMEAIDGLSRLKVREPVKDSILKLRYHLSPYVRSSVLRFMRRLYPQQALSLLVKSLNDPDYIVRETAADELGELDNPEVIPNLQELMLKESHPDVREAAKISLNILSSTVS